MRLNAKLRLYAKRWRLLLPAMTLRIFHHYNNDFDWLASFLLNMNSLSPSLYPLPRRQVTLVHQPLFKTQKEFIHLSKKILFGFVSLIRRLALSNKKQMQISEMQMS